jgi:hypothetical protein
VRGAVGDDAARVHHGDRVAQREDEAHVVVHEQHAATLASDFVDERGEPLRLGLAHAGGGLVEEQHGGAGAEAADDLQVAQLAEGKIAGVRARPVGEADRGQQVKRLLLQEPLLLAEQRRADRGP